jgi:hypothetical protein
MKRIHYASGSLLTGDAVAEALVGYAAALAANKTAAEVHAPAVLDSGQRGEVLLLLGPASQILAEDEADQADELLAPEFVADLEQRTRELGPLKADFVQSGTDDVDGMDLDFL